MNLLQALRGDEPGAAARIAATADEARQLGFQDVQTHYLPATHEHTVTGTLPATTARRTIDRCLGR